MDDAHEPQTFQATVKRRNKLVLAAAASPIALIPVLVTLAALTEPFFMVFSLHLLIVGGLALAYAHRRNPWPRREAVEVEVEANALRVGDERIPRAELSRGDRVGPGASVRLKRTRRRETELTLSTDAAARRLLSALGLDAGQTVARFSTLSLTHSSTLRAIATTIGIMAGAVLCAGVLGAIWQPLIPTTMLLGLLTLLGVTAIPSRVEVGGDGVLVRWLGRERFVPHDEITGVRSTVEGFGRSRRGVVIMELRSGEDYKIPVGTIGWGGDSQADALRNRIRDAKLARDGGDAAPDVLRRPEGASFAAWVTKLRTLDVVTHRLAVVPRDRLWRVVEDAAADPVDRAAATVALGSIGDRERERLGRVAQRTAEPRLRVLLESAADASEPELVELLEEVETSAPRRRTAG